jgi:NAD(P)-dependent dehydrogenase (short-subunit alcohol dehydrogenase family)
MTVRRRAIIIGGAGGIGSDIARKMASQGYRLVVADYNVDRAQEVLKTLEGEGHEAAPFDITDPNSISAAFDAVEASEPASILVIASGGPVVHLGQQVNIATMALADWEKTLALNLTGVFSAIQKYAQLRNAKPLEQSRIVIIGSAAGLVAGNGTDVAYMVSKTALFGLARQAAFELAPAGVTVNVVAPGPVATPEFMRNTNEQIRAGIASMSLVKRVATPEEVSGGVLYLLSPEASYITGATIDINGGIHMR